MTAATVAVRERAWLGGMVVAVAFAGAGCGGDGRMSKRAYERAFKGTLARLDRRDRAIRPSVPNPSRAVRVRYIERVRLLVLRADGELDRLEPPAEVSDAHALLVRGVHDYWARTVRRMAAALKRGDDKRVNALLEDPASQPVGPLSDVQRARDEFDAKGYDLGQVEELLP